MLEPKKGSGLWGWLAELLTGEGFSYALQAAIKPLAAIGVGASALWSSIVNHLPLYLLIPFTAVSFAGAMSWLNSIDTFLLRRRIKDQVAVWDVQASDVLSTDGLIVIGYNIFLVINNAAEVPIAYTVRDVSGSLDGLALPELADANNSGECPAKSQRLHGLGTVAYAHEVGRVHRNGKLKVRLDYARSGRRTAQHQFESKFDFNILVDAFGYVQKTNTWIRRDN